MINIQSNLIPQNHMQNYKVSNTFVLYRKNACLLILLKTAANTTMINNVILEIYTRSFLLG